MKTITKNQNNVIECTCGTVLEYDKSDLVLKGVEKTDYYAISVVCPKCGKVHTVKPAEFDSKALIGSVKARKQLSEMTYEELSKAAHSSNKRDIFYINDIIKITLKDGYVAELCVIGIDHDGVDGITFNFVDLYGTDEYGGHMMSTRSTNSTSWVDCSMRKYLNGEFFNLLPDKLQAIIKPVTKKTASNGSGKSSIVETVDKIFLLSEVEVFGKCKHSKSGEGEQYEGFKNWKDRVKGYPDGNCGCWYWLRSPSSVYNNSFCVVSYAGSCSINYADSTNGVVPCFTI